jgi:hypothetical protein
MAVLIYYWVYANFSDETLTYSIRYDPEYVYFLNSLAPIKGKPYHYADHPGTPLELLGTSFLLLSYPVTHSYPKGFIMYHIEHPRLFFTMARGFIMVFSLITLFVISRYVISIRKWQDAVFSLSISVFFFPLYPSSSYQSLATWSHNSFAFPLGTLLLLLILLRIRSNASLSSREILLLGIASGVLVSIQLWFLSWMIGIGSYLLLNDLLEKKLHLSSLKSVLILASGSTIGFICSTLTVIHRYKYFALWVYQLIRHQGRYGTGPAGIFSIGSLREHFQSLWNNAPWVFVTSFICISLTIIYLVVRRRYLSKQRGLWAFSLALCVQLSALFLMILKHPGSLYLLAVSAILPILLASLYLLSREHNTGVLRVAPLIAIPILIAFGIGLRGAINQEWEIAQNIRKVESELESIRSSYIKKIGREPESIRLLWAYGVGSKCAALHFGNRLSNYVFSEEIDRVCPNEGVYMIWRKVNRIRPDERWDIIVIPESFVPENANDFGFIQRSDAETKKYGQVVYIIRSN